MSPGASLEALVTKIFSSDGIRSQATPSTGALPALMQDTRLCFLSTDSIWALLPVLGSLLEAVERIRWLR